MTDNSFIRKAQTATTPSSRRAFMRAHKRSKIQSSLQGCQDCDLYKNRIQAVAIDTAKPRPLAFVVSAPTKQDDENGSPISGRAGDLLNQLIDQSGNVRTDSVSICAVACRPPHSRRPRTDELTACSPNFQQQLDFSGAWVVVLFGDEAVSQVTNRTISQLDSKPFWFKGRIYFAAPDLSAALKKHSLQPIIQKVVTKAFKIVNGDEWWEPYINQLAKDKQTEDLTAMLSSRGWAHYDSFRLSDRVIVVKDDLVKVPIKYVHDIRYTIQELIRIGELGRGGRISTPELQSVHLVKKLGGVIVK